MMCPSSCFGHSFIFLFHPSVVGAFPWSDGGVRVIYIYDLTWFQLFPGHRFLSNFALEKTIIQPGDMAERNSRALSSSVCRVAIVQWVKINSIDSFISSVRDLNLQGRNSVKKWFRELKKNQQAGDMCGFVLEFLQNFFLKGWTGRINHVTAIRQQDP